jgi:hypothetical protein
MKLLIITGILVAYAIAVTPVHGQTLGGSTTIPGNADSVLVGLLAAINKEKCRILRTDRSARAVTAICPGSDDELVFQVHQVRDSVSLSSRGTRGGAAAMITGLSVIQRFVDAPPPGEVRRMPPGDDWAQDDRKRVGFLVLSLDGRRFAKASADTAWEVRPGDLPSGLREDWEDHINRVGFDASCARVFRAGDAFLVRWNQCATPTPDLDRLSIYGADGSWRGTAIGPSITEMISLVCPLRRSGGGLGTDSRCPAPWQ